MLQQAADTVSLLQLLSGSLLGLFGGIGATALWEGWIRPDRTRRNLSRLLVAEIRMNLRQLQWMIDRRKEEPQFLPLNLALGTGIFDSLPADIGEMHEELLPELVELYARFRNLTQIGATLPALHDEYEAAEDGTPRKSTLETRISSRVDRLYGGLQQCEDAIQALLPRLVRGARLRSAPPSLPERSGTRPG